MNDLRIVVFAKAPVPGVAKTRLVSALGPEGASRLATRMLEATLDACLGANIGKLELRMEPGPGDIEWQGVAIPSGIELSEQGDGDLGERLSRATLGPIARGESVILVGADCADLSASLLRDAARQLSAAGTVIYPATDGGYVLLGLTKYSPDLFSNIPWSTDTVAAETIRRCLALGWTPHVGPTCHDVDVPEDLAHAPTDWLADLPVRKYEE